MLGASSPQLAASKVTQTQSCAKGPVPSAVNGVVRSFRPLGLSLLVLL